MIAVSRIAVIFMFYDFNKMEEKFDVCCWMSKLKEKV